MSNIRTTAEEFAVSGSLKDPQQKLTSTNLDEGSLQETVIFLAKKIDELVTEVNTLKNNQ
tara:strand:- start:587 stop:766 length:180 start_codon:yes stop_codon:yes gene_type:complete